MFTVTNNNPPPPEVVFARGSLGAGFGGQGGNNKRLAVSGDLHKSGAGNCTLRAGSSVSCLPNCTLLAGF